MRVRLRRSGRVLHVVGAPPQKPGDHFEATAAPPESEAASTDSKPGCELGASPDGSRYFSCRRGARTPAREVPKSFKYDPELHELVVEVKRLGFVCGGCGKREVSETGGFYLPAGWAWAPDARSRTDMQSPACSPACADRIYAS